VLEVLFGYKGRLYFRNTKDRGVEVLTIGTKNTQAGSSNFSPNFNFFSLYLVHNMESIKLLNVTNQSCLKTTFQTLPSYQ
jgi:hypothetical protein